MFGLENVDLQRIVAIFRQNENIESATIFGSRAKGDFRNGSDIDISIKGVNLHFDDLIEISQQYEKLNLPYKFDVVIYDRIKEDALKEYIRRVEKTIY